MRLDAHVRVAVRIRLVVRAFAHRQRCRAIVLTRREGRRCWQELIVRCIGIWGSGHGRRRHCPAMKRWLFEDGGRRRDRRELFRRNRRQRDLSLDSGKDVLVRAIRELLNQSMSGEA